MIRAQFMIHIDICADFIRFVLRVFLFGAETESGTCPGKGAFVGKLRFGGEAGVRVAFVDRIPGHRNQ